LTRAIAAARTPKLCLNTATLADATAHAATEGVQVGTRPKRIAGNSAPTGSARSLLPSPDIRAARSRTRRRLHEPRPTISPEARARRGQWRAQVEAAQLAGNIGKSVHLYLFALLEIPSVARGDHCIYSDAQMARRLNNVDVGTVRRHRRQAKKAGLIEVLGHGRDRKPCLVRPILLDGTPVFPGPELVGKTGNFAGLTQAILPADLLLTDLPEVPLLPPAVEASTSAVEGEAEIDLTEEEAAEGVPPPEPAPIPASEPASTSTPIPAPISNPTSAPKSNPAPRVPFEELWKLNPRGWIGRGRTAYLRLSDAQTHAAKADLEAVLRRGPLPHGFDYAGTHFAMIRLGQPAAPISAPAEASVRVPTKVYVRPGTPECRAWERYWRATTGLDMPTDKNGGWYFESRLPPGTEEGQAARGSAKEARTCIRANLVMVNEVLAFIERRTAELERSR
jgi:hypothetical protein